MSSKSGWHGPHSCPQLYDRELQIRRINEYHIRWQIPLQGVAKTNFTAIVCSTVDEPVAPGPLLLVSLNMLEMQVHIFDPRLAFEGEY
jgi:hypothetical protein